MGQLFDSFSTTKVKEYVWRLDVTYELVAFVGGDDHQSSRVVLQSGSAGTELSTAAKKTPRPE